MNKSDQINHLATALCKAQSEMAGASKDASNPFFKSKYADLGSVIKAIKAPFANNGLSIDTVLNDFGRMKMTKRVADSLKFKIPTLRNVEFSYPYMHDGRFKRLSEVLDHYTNDIQDSPSLANELKQSIKLTSNEKVDLTAFLLTLTDKEFLFNRDYSYPRTFFQNN